MNTLLPEDEHGLVALAQTGSAVAFDKLTRSHLRWLKNSLARFKLRHEDLDDIIQTVLINSWRGIRAFRGESAFRTWLYRIAVNAANNHFQSTANRLSTRCVSLSGTYSDENDHAQIDIAHADTPEQLLEARQRLAEIQRVLECLSPELATTFELRTIQGLAYAEIAAYLGIPLGTVRSRISRARAALGLLQE